MNFSPFTQNYPQIVEVEIDEEIVEVPVQAPLEVDPLPRRITLAVCNSFVFPFFLPLNPGTRLPGPCSA